jgi:Fur family transcriptional regulator, ferric uptake regulator
MLKTKSSELKKLITKSDGIYRVLKKVRMVNKDGMGAEINFGYSIKQFKCKKGCEHHNHLICVVCKTHVYLDSAPLEDLQDKLAKDKGFVPKKHNFQIFGVCANCR